MLDFSRKDKEEQGTQCAELTYWVSTSQSSEFSSVHFTPLYEVSNQRWRGYLHNCRVFHCLWRVVGLFGASRWLSGKGFVCQGRRLRSDSGSGRSPGVGNGNPLQNSCLENSANGEDWWAAVSNWACMLVYLILTTPWDHYSQLKQAQKHHQDDSKWIWPQCLSLRSWFTLKTL